MKSASDEALVRAASDHVGPREAAHAIAVERVAEATRLRGLYPGPACDPNLPHEVCSPRFRAAVVTQRPTSGR